MRVLRQKEIEMDSSLFSRRRVFVTVIGMLVIWYFIAWIRAHLEAANTEIKVLGGVDIQYLLTPETARDIPSPLGEEFDVTKEDTILLQAGSQLIELAQGKEGLQAEPVGAKVPDSFAVVNGDVLLSINGHFFGQLEEDGFSKALTLPVKGMKLRASTNRGAVLLYGGTRITQGRLYLLYEDGRMDILVEFDQPIINVCDNRNAVYVALEREIYRLTSKRADLVLRLPEEHTPIVSLAAAQDDRILYFSTETHVYGLHGTASLAVLKDIGGEVRIRAGRLYVFDAPKKLLVAVNSTEAALFSEEDR